MATLTIGGQKIGDYGTDQEAQQAYYKWALQNRANIGGPTGDAPDSNQAFIDGQRFYVDSSGRGQGEGSDFEAAIFAAQTNKATQAQLNLLSSKLGGTPDDYKNYLNPDFLPIAQNKPNGEVDPRLQASPFEGGKFSGYLGEATQYSQTDPRYQKPMGVLQTPKLTPQQQQAQAQALFNPQMVFGDGINTAGVAGTAGAPVQGLPQGTQGGNEMLYNALAPDGTYYSGPANRAPIGTIPQQQQLPQQIPDTTLNQVPTFNRNLKPGDTGADVQALQQYLMGEGFTISAGATGYYGEQTKAAVAAWQQAHGIDTAGNAGFFGPRSQAFLETQNQGDPRDMTPDPDPQVKINNLTRQHGFQIDHGLASQYAQQDPVKFVTDMYDKLYNTSGLPELKSKIDGFTKDLTEISNEEIDKVQEVNDNPWLSEGVRVGRVRSINEKYEAKKAVFADLLKYSTDLYQSGQDQAKFITQQALETYNDRVNFQEQAYLKAMDSAASLAELKYKMENDKSYSNFKEVNGGIYDLDTNKWVVPPKAGSGGGLTDSQYFSFTNSLRDDARNDPDVKDFVAIRDGYERVQTGANLDNAQGDLALLFGYMKILDPTSVVRETEFANAEMAMGYAQRILNIPAKAINGSRLTPSARQDFASAAKTLYNTKKANYDKAAAFYKQSAEQFGIDPSLVARDFSSTQTQGTYSPNSVIINNGTYYLVGSDGETVMPFKPLDNPFD